MKLLPLALLSACLLSPLAHAEDDDLPCRTDGPPDLPPSTLACPVGSYPVFLPPSSGGGCEPADEECIPDTTPPVYSLDCVAQGNAWRCTSWPTGPNISHSWRLTSLFGQANGSNLLVTAVPGSNEALVSCIAPGRSGRLIARTVLANNMSNEQSKTLACP